MPTSDELLLQRILFCFTGFLHLSQYALRKINDAVAKSIHHANLPSQKNQTRTTQFL